MAETTQLNTPILDLTQPLPVLLLDIDGLLSVFQCSTARATEQSLHLPLMQMVPNLQTQLRQLDAAFNLVWCSTAGPLVNGDAAAAWGFAPRPCILPTPDEASVPHWKVLAVARTFADWPGTLAWVADDVASQARHWAIGRIGQGRRTWLIDVAETGLTDQITADLVEWAAE